jgi:ubiquinone/menaquinone biosynthesis C-methylase UbiE
VNPAKPFIEYYLRRANRADGRNDRATRSMAAHLGRIDSLLDVGCGDGSNTQRVAEMTGATKVAGVDVHLRESSLIPVERYDGLNIPFPDRSFDAVTLIDVLHHCDAPQRVLAEAVRVARKGVVVKDHFAFGPVSRKVLYLMDVFGNGLAGIHTPGTYFDMTQWVRMIDGAGARLAALDWPLKIHDMPWRIVGWPELQFTAKLIPVRDA